MKKIWYLFVKYYMRIGFAFYFKKVKISGLSNIPQNKAVMFVANHQNALIDPLLIGSRSPRELNFLTRADVFNKPLTKWFLSTVNMLPIYRIKDGITSLAKNEEVFKKCHSILHKEGTILIFPEGNHNIKRRLRVLSKGFTRIVYGAIDENPNQEIFVVPIGINYTNAKKFGSSVHLIFGESIQVKNAKAIKETSELKNDVSEALKKLISHIDDLNHYDTLEQAFSEDEFMDPIRVNQQLEKLQPPVDKANQKKDQFEWMRLLIYLNSSIPVLIWKKFAPSIKEEEFISTFRFTIGITLFPLFYLIQTSIIWFFFGDFIAATYLILSFLIVYLFVKLK